MKFRMVVTDERGEEWNEDENRSEIANIEEAQQWATDTIAMFNRTLRPGERERTLVRVESLAGDESVAESHDWEKTNLITLMGKYFGSYDTVKCKKCGITGKRHGLDRGIDRDPEFKALGYATCDGAKKLLERKRKRKLKAEEQGDD